MRFNQHHTTAQDHNRARSFRNNATPMEKKLWLALRQQAKLHGLRFRRQAVIRPFIADFACMEARLVIELDGYSHDTRQVYDHMRDEKIKQAGYSILRFNNEDVDQNLEGVVAVILQQAEQLLKNLQADLSPEAPTPYPLPRGEGESQPDRIV